MTFTEIAHDSNVSTYRNAYRATWAAAFACYFGLIAIGYPLAGVGTFVVGVAVAVSLRQTYGGPLFDERDREIHRTAADWTVAVFGWAAAVTFPTLVVLEALGRYEWSAWTTTIAGAVFAFYGLYALLLVSVRLRQ